MNKEGEVHVTPDEDLRDHHTTQKCWCRPFDEGEMWVHNSMDRREREKN